jgi:sarcosine oxidase, subunit delta
MMQLECPVCGMRDEPEFVCGGTAQIARPNLEATNQQWAEYLFFRSNPKGPHLERWRHSFGCGLWFDVLRDTATHEVAPRDLKSPP